MPIVNCIILTAAQVTTVEGLNPPPSSGVEVEPRLIDATNPGVGINLNPLATGFAGGSVIDLSGGKSIAPAAIVNNSDWVAYPAMTSFLMTCPMCLVDSAIIFAP